ncbi:hypothetical protein P7K49_036192 [Saguinus oedipus]|uniref:Uncharacterized protein n=1 Tax=Saguinus oedipus TaxID=9490 RepID=A0ABQ9TL53_SAGOE|nr:hypothetical protein P7K49_036192 [Saguinus oedipus]
MGYFELLVDPCCPAALLCSLTGANSSSGHGGGACAKQPVGHICVPSSHGVHQPRIHRGAGSAGDAEDPRAHAPPGAAGMTESSFRPLVCSWPTRPNPPEAGKGLSAEAEPAGPLRSSSSARSWVGGGSG